MALQPTPPVRKTRLFAASRPNYNDFNGPPDGDYVRYVEGLMAWAQQEQERQRLKTLGDKQRTSTARTPDAQWGRSASAAAAVAGDAFAQPGSVDSAVERFKRKAQRQAMKLQQQAAAAAQWPDKAERKSAAKSGGIGGSWVLFIGVLIAVSIFASAWLPAVIIAWVVFNVIRAVRAASGAGKS